MQQSLADIRLALRVLEAVTDGLHPDPHDVEELYRVAPAVEFDSYDEMACAIIQRALERRRQVRDAGLNAQEQPTTDGSGSFDRRDGG
jgi:hypothetical protein